MKTTPRIHCTAFVLLAAVGLMMAGCAGNEAAAPPTQQSAMMPGQTGCAYDLSAMNCYENGGEYTVPAY